MQQLVVSEKMSGCYCEILGVFFLQGKKQCSGSDIFVFLPDTPSQRVQFILGTEDDDEEHIPHDLFTELDEICWREGEDAEWRETAR